MANLPTKFTLSRKPKEYLKQGPSHCGVYSLKAILSAYGKDNKIHPKEYHSNWFSKKFFSFAVGKHYYDNILKSYGIKSETASAKNLSNKQKLELLKESLIKNSPVMIRIGNGYFGSKKYNPFLGKVLPHWITLWGYDDEKQIFYVYDSALSRNYWNLNLPVGNTTRTYKEILRDWNPWLLFGCSTSPESHLFLRIKDSEGKTVEYFEYEGQDHNFKNLGWDEISERTINFFNKYLKK